MIASVSVGHSNDQPRIVAKFQTAVNREELQSVFDQDAGLPEMLDGIWIKNGMQWQARQGFSSHKIPTYNVIRLMVLKAGAIKIGLIAKLGGSFTIAATPGEPYALLSFSATVLNADSVSSDGRFKIGEQLIEWAGDEANMEWEIKSTQTEMNL